MSPFIHLRRLVCVGMLVGVWSTSAEGAIVVLKSQAEPVVGQIIRQDQVHVVVKTRDDAGKVKEHTLDRSDIVEIIETVSPKRLSELSPKQPASYRDYAEELAAKQRDFEARETAIRLYAIAFSLDRARLGTSALRGLITLARSPQEEQRFRAALFLLDPRQSIENLAAIKNAADAKKEQAGIEETLRGVHLLRRGQGGPARPIFAKPEVAKVLQGYEAFISRSELDTACKEIVLSDRRLRQVLLLELALESLRAKPEEGAAEGSDLAWGRELQSGGNAVVPVVDLNHLTEFDTRLSVFRDGKWVAP